MIQYDADPMSCATEKSEFPARADFDARISRRIVIQDVRGVTAGPVVPLALRRSVAIAQLEIHLQHIDHPFSHQTP